MYIQILMTPDNETLYIQKRTSRTMYSITIPPHVYTDGTSVFGFQKISFAEAIYKRQGWDTKGVYRIKGVSVSEDIMAFHFNIAERIDG